MKKFYPGRANHLFAFYSKILLFAVISSLVFIPAHAQGLVFKDPVLISGTAGEDGATYRFPDVTTNVDALIKINGRSSALVSLVSIDLTTTGFDKSFQPQVSYNNGTTPSGVSDWWMEFGISFVKKNTSTMLNVSAFDVTGLDIDGNADKINEWVCFYNLKSYIMEQNSLLQYQGVWELLNGINTLVGEKFNGPITNYIDIDTTATDVMTTITYQNLNSFRLRTGGHSIDQSGASDRMYSFWFKSFNFQTPVELGLPVSLRSFTVKTENKRPLLSWVTSAEKSLNYYLVQRSFNGIDYADAAYVFANDDTHGDVSYSYPDNISSSAKGIVYYRLKMVDMDGKYEYSETRLVRLNEPDNAMQIQTYPNPAYNELRVTIPNSWQQGKIQYDIYAGNGQLMKQLIRTNTNQTEVLDISKLTEGIYVIKVSGENKQSTQRFIKIK